MLFRTTFLQQIYNKIYNISAYFTQHKKFTTFLQHLTIKIYEVIEGFREF